MIVLLIVLAVCAYLLASAVAGVLHGCLRALRARRQYRDGRSAKIHEADRRLRNKRLL
jgi:formate hydrogenlyase subunit 4